MLVYGVVAGAEIAILSIRKSWLAELADGDRLAVKATVALRSNPERFLVTVQIGITVVGTATAAHGAANVADTFAGGRLAVVN